MLSSTYLSWFGMATWIAAKRAFFHCDTVSISPCLSSGRFQLAITAELKQGSALVNSVAEDINQVRIDAAHWEWLLDPSLDVTLNYTEDHVLGIQSYAKDVPASSTEDLYRIIDRRSHRPGYSPQSALESASHMPDINFWIPDWPLAPVLGAIALAVREYIDRDRLQAAAGSSTPVSILAYRIESTRDFKELILDVSDTDPLFTSTAMRWIVEQAHEYAKVFKVDLPQISVVTSSDRWFVHEPDAIKCLIPFIKVPIGSAPLPHILDFRPGVSIINPDLRSFGQNHPNIAHGDGLLAHSVTAEVLRHSTATWGSTATPYPTIVGVDMRDIALAGNSLAYAPLVISINEAASVIQAREEVADLLLGYGLLGNPHAVELSNEDPVEVRTVAAATPCFLPDIYPVAPYVSPRGRSGFRLSGEEHAIVVALARVACSHVVDLSQTEWIGARIANDHSIDIAYCGALDPTVLTTEMAALVPGVDINVTVVKADSGVDASGFVSVYGNHPVYGLLPPWRQLELYHLFPCKE